MVQNLLNWNHARKMFLVYPETCLILLPLNTANNAYGIKFLLFAKTLPLFQFQFISTLTILTKDPVTVIDWSFSMKSPHELNICWSYYLHIFLELFQFIFSCFNSFQFRFFPCSFRMNVIVLKPHWQASILCQINLFLC